MPPAMDYSRLVTLEGAPVEGDVIAYKLLEIGPDFAPVVCCATDLHGCPQSTRCACVAAPVANQGLGGRDSWPQAMFGRHAVCCARVWQRTILLRSAQRAAVWIQRAMTPLSLFGVFNYPPLLVTGLWLPAGPGGGV
jgi:hypothetical protein